MKLTALKFDTPNNAAMSLRVLSEQVRTGEIALVEISPILLETSKAGMAVDRAVGFREREAR